MGRIEFHIDLIRAFKNRKVALFIGAGCSMSAGLPNWSGLIGEIIDFFKKRGLFSSTEIETVEKLYKESSPNAFKTIAGLCKGKSNRAYFDCIKSIFAPHPVPDDFKPPHYYSWFEKLGVKWILTTNFDKLIEGSLRCASLTWQDKGEDGFGSFLLDDRPLIFHIHGVFERGGTIVHAEEDYRRFAGPEGGPAVSFLSAIVQQYAIVFIGYSLGDPFIEWVRRDVWRNLEIRPNWFLLTPQCNLDQAETYRKNLDIELIGYPINPRLLDVVEAHTEGIRQWFNTLGTQLGYETPRNAADWRRIDSEYLDSLPVLSNDSLRQFYRGGTPDWSIVNQGGTVERETADYAVRELLATKFSAIVVTGASGEGKSTAIKQIGLRMLDRGFELFEAIVPNPNIRQILRTINKKTLLLVDSADRIRDLENVLELVRNHVHPVKILLAARANEWLVRKCSSYIDRVVTHVPINRLTENEAFRLAELLLDSGSVHGVSQEVLQKRLLDETNRFLLAAMWTATRGRQLRNILYDAVQNISRQPRGHDLLEALGLVVSVESRNNTSGDPLKCTVRHFLKALGMNHFQAMRLVRRLEGEMRPRFDNEVIGLRHPLISRLLRPILFDGPTPYLSETESVERVLKAAAAISRVESNAWEEDLLWQIPRNYRAIKDFRDRTHKVVKQLRFFEVAVTANPDVARTWYEYTNLCLYVGKDKRAEEVLMQGLKKHPNDQGLLDLKEQLSQ